MRASVIAASLVLGLAQAQAQTQPGATPQNSPDFTAKTAQDPAFAGAEAPKPKGEERKGAASPREGMNYTPTKTPDETTQQPK